MPPLSFTASFLLFVFEVNETVSFLIPNKVLNTSVLNCAFSFAVIRKLFLLPDSLEELNTKVFQDGCESVNDGRGIFKFSAVLMIFRRAQSSFSPVVYVAPSLFREQS